MSVQKSNKKIEVETVEGADETMCTFVINEEDHTLGNALRYIINKNPDVEFCSYCIPHPAEKKINFRIQTRGLPATKVFRKGLQDLYDASEHILNTFESKVNTFQGR